MIQLFLGEKIATSVAIGTALRAAGHGLKIYIMSFDDGLERPRLDNSALHQLTNITLKTSSAPTIDELNLILSNTDFNLIVLIRMLSVLPDSQIEKQALVDLLTTHSEGTMIILTGTTSDEAWMEMADLVTKCECGNIN